MLFWSWHPDGGELRSWLDGELDDRQAQRVADHLDGCADCRTALALSTERAAWTAARLIALDASSAEALNATGLTRIRARASDAATNSPTLPVWRPNPMALLSTSRFRPALLAVAAVLAVAALFVSPTAQTLANDLLSIFRVKRFVAITYDPNQPFRNLLDLSEFGTFNATPRPSQRTASNAAEAGRLAGFEVKLPLDPALGNPAEFMIQDRIETTFTFDVAKARAYLAKRGEKSFTIPDQFDGAKLTITVPPVVTAVYGDPANPRARTTAGVTSGAAQGAWNGVVLVQAISPTVKVDGRVTLDDLRKLLLSMPGLPAETVAQIRAIDDWTSTLPVPVPKGVGITRDVRINGNPGIALADNTGAGGMILWTRDGLVYAVAGTRTADELTRIASAVH